MIVIPNYSWGPFNICVQYTDGACKYYTANVLGIRTSQVNVVSMATSHPFWLISASTI